MTSTTDFDEWLGDNDPEGFEEIYSLYKSVDDRESNGPWDVKTRGDQTFITGPSSTLPLLSEKARLAFLRQVETLKTDPEMDMEGWYAYERAMANPNA